MTFCRSCGKEVPEGAAFCPACGASTGETRSRYVSGGETEFDRLTRDSRTQEHWIRRVVAYIVDWIVVSIVTAIIFLVISVGAGLASVAIAGPSIANFFLPFGPIGLGIFGLEALFFLLYFTFSEGVCHRTLGKSLMGLEVRTTDGTPLDVPKAFVRNISKIYWLLLLLDLIGGFFTKVTPGQRFLDRLAGTIVVSKVTR
jgi:uncharacterized RDD family membrane protein YckC